MKKIIVPVIALLLVSLLVACTGRGGENTYTGDYKEYSNSSNQSSNMSSSLGGDTDSSTVTVPLTTQAGATAPTVVTTQPTTAFSTIDYTPITPDTTKPNVITTYANDPNTTSGYTTAPSGTGDTTSTSGSTASELKYVKINPSDETDVSFRGSAEENDLVIILSVKSSKLKGTPIKSSGTALVYINGVAEKRRNYKVLSVRDSDGAISIEISAPDLNVVKGDRITVDMPEGAIKTKDNIANKKFTSLYGDYD